MRQLKRKTQKTCYLDFSKSLVMDSIWDKKVFLPEMSCSNVSIKVYAVVLANTRIFFKTPSCLKIEDYLKHVYEILTKGWMMEDAD